MKIWFDLSNSPHVNLFRKMIEEFQSDHEIIITTRPLGNAIDLLSMSRLNFQIIGNYYGKNIFKKIFGYPVRIMELYNYLKYINPDIAISQSSFHSPLTANLLGIPSIYMNDNEHAKGNIPSFLFAKKILIPQYFERSIAISQGASPIRLYSYKGIKEGIYLWHFYNELVGLSTDEEKCIFIRPEPWSAQYYNGPLNFMDSLIKELSSVSTVCILPRSDDQYNHYRLFNNKNIFVIEKSKDLKEIVPKCSLFIGAGGSMTREMAAIGVPTISVYQNDLLGVDKYLVENGMMYYEKSLNIDRILKIYHDSTTNMPSKKLLEYGKQTYYYIKSLILGE